jgi:hypothetical protein
MTVAAHMCGAAPVVPARHRSLARVASVAGAPELRLWLHPLVQLHCSSAHLSATMLTVCFGSSLALHPVQLYIKDICIALSAYDPWLVLYIVALKHGFQHAWSVSCCLRGLALSQLGVPFDSAAYIFDCRVALSYLIYLAAVHTFNIAGSHG